MQVKMRMAQYAAAGLCLLCASLFASTASAQVNGALQTTTSTGTTVNGNLYLSKDAVYISGGPQNKNDNGLAPAPGFYYFQVTDPSGAVLLSLDDISCRIVYVNNSGGPGVVDGIPGTDGSDATAGGLGNQNCYHSVGARNMSNGVLPVQVCSSPGQGGCPSGPPPGTPLANLSYYDTPNPGGEYKVWITPVGNYNNCSNPSSNITFGFCDSDSKTDNFKVKNPNQADVIVCKFNDLSDDGIQDNGEPFISGWPITATGIDPGGPAVTDQDGCIDYTVSTFTNGSATVTLTEGTESGFTQTAPANGMYDANGNICTSNCPTTVSGASGPLPASGGFITVVVSPGATVTAPFFGNTFTPLFPLQVTKTAMGGNNFTWTVTKSAGQAQIDTTTGTATFNYTVTVTHDGGTGWMVKGSISVTNPNTAGGSDGLGGIDQLSITDNIDNGGTCNVNGSGSNQYMAGTINGGATLTVLYTCTFNQNPGSGNNTVSVSWDPIFIGGGPVPFTAPYNFNSADTIATITDSLAGNLGTVTINNDNSTSCATATTGFTGDSGSLANPSCGSTSTFTYTITFSGDAKGTCTPHVNTASFTTNTNGTGSSSPLTVLQCVGEDVTLMKTATANFTAGISKSVNKTTVQQSGGSITFNYTVSLTSPVFTVTGTITVTNPNNWESITVNVADTIDSGGICSVTGGSGITIPAKGSSGPLAYTCTYSSNPTLVSGANSATASETGTLDTGTGDPNNGKSGIVPGMPAPGTAPYTFPTLTVTDNVQDSANPGGCNATLGTVKVVVTGTTVSTSPGCGVANLMTPSWGKFTYSITDVNASPGACTSFNNTATITGGSSSNQITVTVCNTNTGALTMGFWKNSNGQKIITSYCGGNGGTSGTSLMAFLSILNPYRDDTATTCAKEATYVANIISAATCTSSTNTCNSMLRAQMLATALDVYFSTPSLGGNQIGAFNGLGSKTPQLGMVAIDLSHICSMADSSTGSSCTGAFEDARPEFGISTTSKPQVLGIYVDNPVTPPPYSLLTYSDFLSAMNGSPVATASTGATWYNQVKAKQVIAKDVFDNINNNVANIAPPSGIGAPSF